VPNTRRVVNEAIKDRNLWDMITMGSQKSKVQFLLTNRGQFKDMSRTPKYIRELPRSLVSTMFKARTRMLDIKNNFRGKYDDTKCRGCGTKLETQEHVLEECMMIHPDNTNKVEKKDIFNDEVTDKELHVIATKIKYSMDKIQKSDAPPRQ
jgi:hypothetical protein